MTRYAYSYLNGTTDTGLRQSVIDSVANTTTTYTYDGVNRLTRAQTTPNTGGTGNPSDYQYGYDATGNRTSTTIGGAGAAASFNEADEQTDWNTGQDRTYTYDANGNETGSSANESRAYNSRNQTVSITGLNGIPTGMGYLDGGQGERATAGGSAYVNDSLGVASKTKGGQTTYYTRTPSGHLVSQRTPTATYYYLFDGLGSVVGMVDPFGNVAARYGYDPYGQSVTKTGPDSNPSYLTVADGNPFRYTGAYLDGTGLYKLGERYYDPARGRFTQLDPLGSGYVYASDDPVNRIDPSGLDDCSDQNSSCNAPPPGQDVADPCGPDCPSGAGVQRAFVPGENYARQQLGLSRADFREAVHAIKDANGIPADGNLLFDIDDGPGRGDVYYNGDNVGNLFDELHMSSSSDDSDDHH